HLSGSVPNVVVNEVLPRGTTFVSLTAPGATCTTPAVGGTGTVQCAFGWMNPGASSTFQMTVHNYAFTDSGTATGGNANRLDDTGKAWVANAYSGYTVYLTGGQGV